MTCCELLYLCLLFVFRYLPLHFTLYNIMLASFLVFLLLCFQEHIDLVNHVLRQLFDENDMSTDEDNSPADE